jgi:hypothetical protein
MTRKNRPVKKSCMTQRIKTKLVTIIYYSPWFIAFYFVFIVVCVLVFYLIKYDIISNTYVFLIETLCLLYTYKFQLVFLIKYFNENLGIYWHIYFFNNIWIIYC